MRRTNLFVLTMLPVAAAFAAGAMTDQNFVEEAAQGGMAEVEVGQLAAQKGSSDAVRKFGQQMVSDHQQNNQKLQSIASGKGLKVPTETDTMHKAMSKKLQGASGEDFDKQYLKGQVADHEKMATLMKRQAESGKDAELKAFAAQTLPVVQQHLEMARSLEQGGKGTHSQH
jgi:putative membrane protein